MGWLQRANDNKLVRLVAKVDEHVADARGVCSAAHCTHQFDGTAEDVRRHHLEVAYRYGKTSG